MDKGTFLPSFFSLVSCWCSHPLYDVVIWCWSSTATGTTLRHKAKGACSRQGRSARLTPSTHCACIRIPGRRPMARCLLLVRLSCLCCNSKSKARRPARVFRTISAFAIRFQVCFCLCLCVVFAYRVCVASSQDTPLSDLVDSVTPVVCSADFLPGNTPQPPQNCSALFPPSHAHSSSSTAASANNNNPSSTAPNTGSASSTAPAQAQSSTAPNVVVSSTGQGQTRLTSSSSAHGGHIVRSTAHAHFGASSTAAHASSSSTANTNTHASSTANSALGETSTGQHNTGSGVQKSHAHHTHAVSAVTLLLAAALACFLCVPAVQTQITP